MAQKVPQRVIYFAAKRKEISKCAFVKLVSSSKKWYLWKGHFQSANFLNFAAPPLLDINCTLQRKNSDIFCICTTTQTNFTSIISYPVIRDSHYQSRPVFCRSLGSRNQTIFGTLKVSMAHMLLSHSDLRDWDEENLCLKISSGIIHNLTNSDYVINSY